MSHLVFYAPEAGASMCGLLLILIDNRVQSEVPRGKLRLVHSYKELLDANCAAALEEGSLHFDEKSRVHLALRKITKRLDELGIPYALAGGMALFLHGVRRFTEDVKLLVSVEGLAAVHQHLDGLGYVPPFHGSKQLRDAEQGVCIEFLVAGQFPGDGKPKPLAFPDPQNVSVQIDGIRIVSLHSLLELKLASGMTNVTRAKDIGDVIELIRVLKLPRDTVEKLNPYLRGKFLELWDAIDADKTSHDQI
jgi:hypothetical protein